jgi:membrane protein involved in D-alanine export
MDPFADFSYFAVLAYVLAPALLAGILGFFNRWWMVGAMVVLLLLQTYDTVAVRPDFRVRELYLVAGYTVFQGGVAWLFLRRKSRWSFYAALTAAILPLAAAKLLPVLFPQTAFGFLGISYVTFRALDVIFSIHDGLIKQLSPAQYGAFLLFVPALSSGPIDRYRRFEKDWLKTRNRTEFFADLDVAVQRIAQGFLYKFIIAALVKSYLLDPFAKGWSLPVLCGYMYAYTLYLFFDFAGYSAFAVGVGRVFGVQLPSNFDRPFLARNIRDFWNRWHISLSFWFRDHVYMRFLLAASKGKWFKGKHTASYLGLYLTFGIMGVWHGLTAYYVLYGLYHATLLSFYDWFARWNKEHKWWGSSRAHTVADVVLTFHIIAFGLLLFSGRLHPVPPPAFEQVLEKADCHEVTGFVWDRQKQATAPEVDLVVDDFYIQRLPADGFREDLRERGYGNGKHGFRFEIPWWVRDGRPHIIEVRHASTGAALSGGPVTLECKRDDEEISREEQKLQKAREQTPGGAPQN